MVHIVTTTTTDVDFPPMTGFVKPVEDALHQVRSVRARRFLRADREGPLRCHPFIERTVPPRRLQLRDELIAVDPYYEGRLSSYCLTGVPGRGEKLAWTRTLAPAPHQCTGRFVNTVAVRIPCRKPTRGICMYYTPTRSAYSVEIAASSWTPVQAVLSLRLAPLWRLTQYSLEGVGG